MSNNNETQRVLKEKLSIKNFPEFSLIFFQKSIFSLSFPGFPWDFLKKSIYPVFPGFFKVCLNPGLTNLEKMGKNLTLGPILACLAKFVPQIFLWVLPLLDFRNCCKLSFCSISRKTNDPNLIKSWKTSFWV